MKNILRRVLKLLGATILIIFSPYFLGLLIRIFDNLYFNGEIFNGITYTVFIWLVGSMFFFLPILLIAISYRIFLYIKYGE